MLLRELRIHSGLTQSCSCSDRILGNLFASVNMYFKTYVHVYEGMTQCDIYMYYLLEYTYVHVCCNDAN